MNTKILLALLVAGLLGMSAVFADPTGGVLTQGATSRGSNPLATNVTAQAGNVTALNIDQTRVTDIWQGFYGNVSGTIVLENSGGNNFYDWTNAAIQGEVYATRSLITSWAGMNCTNATTLISEETALNIGVDVTDGINETYDSATHPAFSVGTGGITINSCPSTRPYNSTGVASNFYNVMLTSSTGQVVYTAVLDDNENAYDNSQADFEILVPTDKSTGLSTYYFYVELN